MKTLKNKFLVKKIERLNNSIYGNPRFEVVLENEKGETLKAKTKSDASINYYGIEHKKNKTIEFAYHFTKNNNLILDSIL